MKSGLYTALTFLILIVIGHLSCTGVKEVTQSSPPAISDSVKVVTVFGEMLQACWACKPEVNCSKVAPYIIYSGRKDPDRAWKELADYSKEEDRKIVSAFCKRIKKLMPEGTKYRIAGFLQDKESEGVWNVISVIPDNPDLPKGATIEFAFLPIDRSFALGDIDDR